MSIENRIAAQDPTERITFGHGSFGVQCRFCGGTDYLGPLEHKTDCVWVESSDIIARPVDPGRNQQ